MINWSANMTPDILESLIEPQINSFYAVRHKDLADPTFIPIHITGGIGDVIISLDGIRELSKHYKIMVYTHHIEAFRYFCKYLPALKEIPDLTWRLEFNTIAKFHFSDNFGGFLVQSHTDLWRKQEDLLKKDPGLESIVKTHFDKFFIIATHAKLLNIDRRTFPMRCLGFMGELFYEFLPKKETKPYITIHDGFDIHNRSIVSGRATKQWDWKHWNSLVRELKKLKPGYKIIQLGTSHTARAIDGVDECLIDKTTITECFDILASSSLHIDGDSGLVHAATRMQVPCVVLWGPTPDHFYGYSQNINIKSNVCRSACYGVKKNWNDRCVIGHPTPKCMDEITPKMVMERIGQICI